MAGLGLKRILEEVYGENAVVHMMTGKSVQRSFRGHLLVTKCLNQMIVSEVLDEHPNLGSLVDKAEDIYESFVNGESNLDIAVAFDALVRLTEELGNKKTELRGRFKISQLWLCYQSMFRVALALIKADRTGN